MSSTISKQAAHASAELRGRLLAMYAALHRHFGHEPHWWPIYTDTPQFEIIVGAVLVQQTRWETAEAAVVRLRDAGLLTPAALAAADTAALAGLLRPCAFYTQKALGLQAICCHLLDHYGGDVTRLLAQDRAPLRAELLALPRIGPETADTIMLYAGSHPVFVVDAYARRLFARLGLLPGFDFTRAPYDAIQRLIEAALTPWDEEPRTKNQEPRTENQTLYGGPSVGAPRTPTADRHGEEERERGGDKDHATRNTQHVSRKSATDNGPRTTDHGQLTTDHLDGSLRHFLWDLHALINEACIHHCQATRPRQDRPGAKRTFVDPRKCADHCIACTGCPLREMCATYQEAI